MINYKGARWYKCDLHLHTPASKCFKNREVTAEEWISKVREMELDCIAVTDHNTGEWIDKIKEAAKDYNIVVFPGVELTCDTAKIHLLILFDTDKETQDINDFLIKCNVSRETFANSEAHSNRSISDIADIAAECGAIVIPAHIDEFNGLYSVSNSSLREFYSRKDINVVQVVHQEFISLISNVSNDIKLKNQINAYYNNPVPEIGSDTIKKYYDTVQSAINKGLSLVTFSDNPESDEPSKHGINGIGSNYTWIKMDENPDLESLRQAFLFPVRIKNCFNFKDKPYFLPKLWIKSVSILNTQLNKKDKEARFEFNPQLTTIIGGRGSGKSSILRFIRGVFAKLSDISDLEEIIKDHTDFFKLQDSNTQKGVLGIGSKVIVEIIRDNFLYRVIFEKLSDNNNSILVEKYDEEKDAYDIVDDEHFIDFFEFEQYSQKQIYSIAQKPNSLRDRIDNVLPNIALLKNELIQIQKEFLAKSAEIRTIQQSVANKGKLQTEIRDFEQKLELLQKSGITELMKEQHQYLLQNSILNTFLQTIFHKKDSLNHYNDCFSIPVIDFEQIDDRYKIEIQSIINDFFKNNNELKVRFNQIVSDYDVNYNSLVEKLEKSMFFLHKKDKNEEFQRQKEELESRGISDFSDFELYVSQLKGKNEDLVKILDAESKLTSLIEERNYLQNLYIFKRKQITQERQNFVQDIINAEKIKINIKGFRDQNDFVNKLRKIIQKPTSFRDGIEYLKDMCYTGGAFEEKIKEFREIFHSIKENRTEGMALDGHFINMVYSLADAQIDEIELLLPEDEIEVLYKLKGNSQFKPLAVASAGQKTTAILTFILSFGNTPLLLDQPEDDLDNRLVYDLIVEKLKEIKEKRQIIVVTHNANIPVNGDSEYIISLSSDKKYIDIQAAGTVEKNEMKKEICAVMEGGEEAFKMRVQRYNNII